jgi:hypothetical protein
LELKKFLVISGLIVCIVAFEFLALLATQGWFDAVFYHIGTEWMPGMIFGILINEAVLILAVNYLNRQYDRISGYMGKRRHFGRWSRTLIFAGLVTILGWMLVLLIFLMNDMHSFNAHRGWIYVIGMAVLAAVWIYAANYRKNKDAGARIHDLMKENVLQKDRRYTILLEKKTETETDRTDVEGMVHGEVHCGDQVYVLYPHQKEQICRIAEIHAGEQKVTKAKDMMAVITLKDLAKQELPAFTVLSSIHPAQTQLASGVNAAENPYLLGIMMEYVRFNREEGYYDLLFYGICHSQYLAAGTAQSVLKGGDIMDILPDRTDVGFPSVTPVGGKEQILPIFTDWDALHRWKDMIMAGNSVTIALNFPQLIPLLKDRFTGLVINPFGPKPFALSQELLRTIVSSSSYQNEFVLHKEEKKEQ